MYRGRAAPGRRRQSSRQPGSFAAEWDRGPRPRQARRRPARKRRSRAWHCFPPHGASLDPYCRRHPSRRNHPTDWNDPARTWPSVQMRRRRRCRPDRVRRRRCPSIEEPLRCRNVYFFGRIRRRLGDGSGSRAGGWCRRRRCRLGRSRIFKRLNSHRGRLVVRADVKRKGPIRMIGPRRDNDVIAGIDGYGKLPLLGRNGASIRRGCGGRSRHHGARRRS